MTAGAPGRRIDSWADRRAGNRRQAALMRVSTAIIGGAAILVAVYVQEIADVDRLFADMAKIFGCALVIALAVEAGAGMRNLLRADILMLVALYGLIFLEFLFPQDSFAGRVSPEGAQTGTTAALIGFAGIALGRHLPLRIAPSGARPPVGDLSRRGLIQLFLLIATVGYLHILLAVNFDLLEAMRQMAMPRFSQSWSRGRIGGVDTLIHELGLLIYIIPPLAGTVLAQPRHYGGAAIAVVAAVFALTLYKGFAGGTRNEFLVYIITFLVAYLLARPRITTRELLTAVAPATAAGMLGSIYMLEFRNVGLVHYDIEELPVDTFFVDLNLINISRLTEVFPEVYGYLGWEIPFHALIRPIPRAIWSGKPEGLSIGIEEALGMQGLTVSASFVGEAYMAAGLAGVAVAALVLGSLAGSWNTLGGRLRSRFELIFYASGFFAAALAMRSILHVAPALLPSLALWFYARLFLVLDRRPTRRGGKGRGFAGVRTGDG